MASQGGRRNGYMKIRLTLLCAKNLAKKDFFRLPDPFAKITVDGSGQVHSTEACRNTLDPKWNQHYDLYIGQKDSITISIWNHKKIHKKQGAGFLGCVRIMSNSILRIKDTGFQRLDLQRRSPLQSDAEPVHGQIVISLVSRDRTGLGPMVTDVEALSRDPDELPEGWEERRTAAGRIHYVNHFTRTTQWDRPTRPAVEYIHERPSVPARADSANAAARLQQAGYTSVPNTNCPPNSRDSPSHQHVQQQQQQQQQQSNNNLQISPITGTISPVVNHVVHQQQQQQQQQTTPSRQGGAPMHRDRRRSTRHRNYLNRSQLHQAVDLPEGYEQRTTSQGQVYYLHLQTGISTWHDPRVPRDLGNLDNLDLGSLPTGWEARQFPGGRVYYVNHNNRTTQFTDPRLTHNPELLRRVLQATARQTTPPSTVTVQDDGPPPPRHAPQPARCDKENESPVPKYTRDLVHKMKSLRQELHALQPQTGHCRLEVSREEIFEESYRQVMKMRPKDLRKRLMVKFRGEEGLDYGGVAREWLYLLSHEMLNPYYGLFQYSRDDIYTLQINPDSSVNPEHLSYFHFVGRIMGIAIFHGHYIDGGFTMPFYKQLLAKPISLDDIEEVDPELHRSLVWILENDITDIIHNTFCVEYQAFGVDRVVELKPGGEEIPVSEDTKREYVRLYVNWRFMRGIEAQFLALQKGFNELIPHHLLRPFDERELELMIGGLGKIDLDDWKLHTRLKHCSAETNIVRWFWRAVDDFDEEKRARLLQFVTGSSRVPLQGFKALQGSTGAAGPRLFTIHQVEISTDNLPKAHTCFNRIDIPPYETYDKLLDKLTCAVEETCGFAVE